MPLGKVVGLGPGHILNGDPVGTHPPTAAPPHFRPMPIVAKRSPMSATAEFLLKVLIEAFCTTFANIGLVFQICTYATRY